MQIVGRPYADADVLRAARALEAQAPWPGLAEPVAEATS
jgi:Asp-tRNA(Asn)/Glu-tRNA(Gln) amidotransferase A subunit family amidase